MFGMAEIHFEVTSSLGKRIRVTKSYWNFIITAKHPMMAGKEALVEDALMNAEEVRRSNKDKEVFIYYKRTKRYFIAVVCKHLNGSGYIITTYITDRIKIGDIV
jgi:hypothetical protein